jgi:hypothetical protein
VRLIADLGQAEGSFSTLAPKGLLRVNLQRTLARYLVVPAWPGFLARPHVIILPNSFEGMEHVIRG